MNELNQQDESKLQQIQKRLDSAEHKRSIQFQAMLEKLQEHVRYFRHGPNFCLKLN